MIKRAGAVGFVLLLFGCNGDDERRAFNEKLMAEKMNCPQGSIAEVHAWGKRGVSRSCKMKHGKFTGWEDGRKIYEVHYEYGKVVGKEIWFDENGNVIPEKK